ncbi:MAG: hypothetical protein V7742_14445 [Halioglobus sp.]
MNTVVGIGLLSFTALVGAEQKRYEDFVDVESVAVSSMFALQAASVYRSEFYTPETDGFSGCGDAAFSKEIFNIAVTVITHLRLNR